MNVKKWVNLLNSMLQKKKHIYIYKNENKHHAMLSLIRSNVV